MVSTVPLASPVLSPDGTPLTAKRHSYLDFVLNDEHENPQRELEDSLNLLRSEWREGIQERVIDSFRRFDTNGDGMVDYDEFIHGCRSNSSLSERRLKKLFEALDKDGNKQLDYFEFVDLLTGKKSLITQGPRCWAIILITGFSLLVVPE